MKIAILGNSESGKTLAAGICAKLLGTRYANTSDRLIADLAAKLGESPDYIKARKSEYRDAIFDFGRKKQLVDPLYPQREQLEDADIITGLRNPDEVKAARSNHLYDVIIWIARPDVSPNNTDHLTPSDADVVVNNSGTIEFLREQLKEVIVEYMPL